MATIEAQIIEIMNNHSDDSMAVVTKIIAERFGFGEPRARAYYSGMVRKGQAPGRVEPKVARMGKSVMANRSLVEWTGGSRVTLAIVFTDIVESTALGVELADARMNEVRLAHFAHSRTLLAQHGGREIKTIGDSVMAVFRSVGAAFDYAHAVHLDPGPAELQTRGVRAGVHIGALDIIENDVHGTEVAVAARVAHAIDGSELWISDQAKQDLSREGRHKNLEWQLRDNVELKGLGAARLWRLVPTKTPAD